MYHSDRLRMLFMLVQSITKGLGDKKSLKFLLLWNGIVSWRKNVSRCLKKWSSMSERSGEYGGCGKVLYLK